MISWDQALFIKAEGHAFHRPQGGFETIRERFTGGLVLSAGALRDLSLARVARGIMLFRGLRDARPEVMRACPKANRVKYFIGHRLLIKLIKLIVVSAILLDSCVASRFQLMVRTVQHGAKNYLLPQISKYCQLSGGNSLE